MVTRAPLRISLFTKSFAPLDWVGAPLEAHFTIRAHAASIGSFVLDDDDEQLATLATAGTRAVVEYFHDPTSDVPVFLMSGLIGEREGESGPGGRRTFEIWDDWAYVMGLLGWQNPTGTIAQQGDDDAYYTITDDAETVVKTLVAANATRLGVPVTCATNLSRGDNITASVRMHPLVDRLYPAVAQAGIVVTVRQSGAGLVVDCYEPDTLTETLTEASGVIVGGKWTSHPPTVTRVNIGGGGEGLARVYRTVVNTAVESAWGIRIEAFKDARDTSDTAVLDARGWEVLNAGAPSASVSAELSETEDFRTFITVDLGTRVPIQLTGAPLITDQVTEVQIDWTTSDDLLVAPRVGASPTTFEQVASAAIAQVARRTRDQDARS
jgi:hypothetical protein